MQGPDQYLNELGIEFAGAVHPEAPAVIDAAHRAFVNWETYYVSSAEALAEFNQEPYRFTGRVTDPISMERFEPSEASPSRQYGGRLFYFANEENAAVFDTAPDSLSVPTIAMRPVMH